jgi:hypothetical protein
MKITKKKWFLVAPKGWQQMYWVNLKAKGWGKPNLEHNAKEKTSKVKQKDGLIRQTKSQASTPDLGKTLDTCNAN